MSHVPKNIYNMTSFKKYLITKKYNRQGNSHSTISRETTKSNKLKVGQVVINGGGNHSKIKLTYLNETRRL